MYTTFAANSLRQQGRVIPASNNSTASKKSRNAGEQVTEPTSPTSAVSSTVTSGRPRRSQVARACEWCRINRIKCDDNQPCQACRNRGGECSNTGKPSLRSLPTATKEIEKLEARVKELERELQASRHPRATLPTPNSTPSPVHHLSIDDIDPMKDHQGKRRQWQESWIEAPRPSETYLSAGSSMPYFVNALQSYIASTLQLSEAEFSMQPKGACHFHASPALSQGNSQDKFQLASDKDDDIHLSRAQEGYFLALFWQSYNCTIPVINETDFREHYESLWSSSKSLASRKPSPLVDIMLALCMQYGMTFVPQHGVSQTPHEGFSSEDPTVAGRALYRRCQTLLSTRLETPSVLILQCQILSAIYARNASFVHVSHDTLASAIRTAQLLGLHRGSPSSSSQTQTELHRRIWWALYAMDSTASMELGRPWLTQMAQVQCALPNNDQDLASLSGPSFTSKTENITWLSYHVLHVKLVLATRAVYAAFESKVTQTLNASNQATFHSSPKALEPLASFLLSSLTCLKAWVQDVPEELKVGRKDGGKPFSTDRSAVQIDLEAPQWLQRQQLLLELVYHHLIMGLYRPFITFASTERSSTPLSNSISISCLNHAITITDMIAQTLRTTDILSGWHDAYHYQWNATLTMVGFIFDNPVCPPTPTARNSINTAIQVFDNFRNNFAIAASASRITCDLAAKVDSFLTRIRTNSASAPKHSLPATDIVSSSAANNTSVLRNLNTNNNPHDSMSNAFQLDVEGDLAMDQTLFPSVISGDLSMDTFSGAEWSFLNDGSDNTNM